MREDFINFMSNRLDNLDEPIEKEPHWHKWRKYSSVLYNTQKREGFYRFIETKKKGQYLYKHCVLAWIELAKLDISICQVSMGLTRNTRGLLMMDVDSKDNSMKMTVENYIEELEKIGLAPNVALRKDSDPYSFQFLFIIPETSKDNIKISIARNLLNNFLEADRNAKGYYCRFPYRDGRNGYTFKFVRKKPYDLDYIINSLENVSSNVSSSSIININKKIGISNTNFLEECESSRSSLAIGTPQKMVLCESTKKVAKERFGREENTRKFILNNHYDLLVEACNDALKRQTLWDLSKELSKTFEPGKGANVPMGTPLTDKELDNLVDNRLIALCVKLKRKPYTEAQKALWSENNRDYGNLIRKLKTIANKGKWKGYEYGKFDRDRARSITGQDIHDMGQEMFYFLCNNNGEKLKRALRKVERERLRLP